MTGPAPHTGKQPPKRRHDDEPEPQFFAAQLPRQRVGTPGVAYGAVRRLSDRFSASAGVADRSPVDGPVVPVSPKHERLKAEVAAMAARDLTIPQIATMLRLPVDRVEDLLDEIDLTPDPAKPGPKVVIRPTNPHEAHYLWWASLTRAKASWLADHGLQEEFWQASADARSFERCARMAAS